MSTAKPVAPLAQGAAPAASGTMALRVLRAGADSRVEKDDRVAVEAPLEIQLHHPALGPEPVAFGTTMRTPGNDDWLAAGLLYGEGIIDGAADIEDIQSSTRRPNVVNVRLQDPVRLGLPWQNRRFSAGSSCGVCGTTGLDDAIARAAATRVTSTARADLRMLLQLPALMRREQARFGDTGGIHACALFDLTGQLHGVAEDVGRHNAFDKLVGENVLAKRIPLADRIVILSGRASFELVQKALRSGVSILGAIGAPSSLAVNLAAAAGLTLVGFLRENHCNIYTRPERLS